MKPQVAFQIPNTLTGEGNFENMEDFSPASIASKVDPLKQLFEARSQLANLLTYMDGKSGAEEELIAKLLNRTGLNASANGRSQAPEIGSHFRKD